MARNKEGVTASFAAINTLYVVALLSASALSVGLQGCHQLEEGTDSTTNEEDGHVSVQDQLPGCWKLRITARGAQRDSLRSWLPAGSLPSIIELDTARAEPVGSDSVYRAYSWSDGRRESQPFSVWRPMEGDSIRVQRAGALAGTMLHLKPAKDKLIGSVVEFTDTGTLSEPRRRRGAVEAIATQCPRR